MSGGSYGYLCFKDAGQLIEGGYDAVLSDMSEDLAQLGYAADVAAETEDVLRILRASRIRIQSRLDALSAVWHAKEWWQSCDCDEDDFKDALAKYRGETDTASRQQTEKGQSDGE